MSKRIYTTDIVKEMMLGKNGALAPLIAMQRDKAHPHLHVGQNQANLEKDTFERFQKMETKEFVTGFLYPTTDSWHKLAQALERAFNSYLLPEMKRVQFNGDLRSFSAFLDLSAFEIGRARMEEAISDGVRFNIIRTTDTEAKNFFIKVVRPATLPPGRYTKVAIIQTIYPCNENPTIKAIKK